MVHLKSSSLSEAQILGSFNRFCTMNRQKKNSPENAARGFVWYNFPPANQIPEISLISSNLIG